MNNKTFIMNFVKIKRKAFMYISGNFLGKLKEELLIIKNI